MSDVITRSRKCAKGLSTRERSIVSELEFPLSLSLFTSLPFTLTAFLREISGNARKSSHTMTGGTTDHWLSRGSLGLMKRFNRTATDEEIKNEERDGTERRGRPRGERVQENQDEERLTLREKKHRISGETD